jgi:hypothetical protein
VVEMASATLTSDSPSMLYGRGDHWRDILRAMKATTMSERMKRTIERVSRIVVDPSVG